jgi:hypothetical protein
MEFCFNISWLFIPFSFLCLAIVQSVSIVDVNLGILLACFHPRRRLMHVPMLPQWWDSLSISHSTDILFLFSDVWGSFQLRRLCRLLITRVVAWDNCSHRLRSLCMVEVMLHGICCGFSMILVVSINRSLVLVLHRFWMALLVSVQSFCDDSSSSSLCLAIPSDSFRMRQILIVSDWQFLFWQVHAQLKLLPCHWSFVSFFPQLSEI